MPQVNYLTAAAHIIAFRGEQLGACSETRPFSLCEGCGLRD